MKRDHYFHREQGCFTTACQYGTCVSSQTKCSYALTDFRDTVTSTVSYLKCTLCVAHRRFIWKYNVYLQYMTTLLPFYGFHAQQHFTFISSLSYTLVFTLHRLFKGPVQCLGLWLGSMFNGCPDPTHCLPLPAGTYSSVQIILLLSPQLYRYLNRIGWFQGMFRHKSEWATTRPSCLPQK